MSIKNNTDNNDVGGHFLCSGSLSEFKATGELGQSVYQVATALRDTIRRHNKTNIPLEKFLAIPYENAQANTVDWYADAGITTNNGQKTTIINWNQADAEEQNLAKEKILHFKEKINSLSESLTQKQKDTTSDLYIFSQLLPKSLIIPTKYGEIKDERNIIDPSYIFLVGSDQQPVLAFWGFSDPNASITEEPFHFLSHPLPATAPSIPAAPALALDAVPTSTASAPTPPPNTPIERKRHVWSWLRWLLLALLFAFLLLFVWRSCSKTTAPTLPSTGQPTLSLSQAPNRLWGMNLPTVSWPSWMHQFGFAPSSNSRVNLESVSGLRTRTADHRVSSNAEKGKNPPLDLDLDLDADAKVAIPDPKPTAPSLSLPDSNAIHADQANLEPHRQSEQAASPALPALGPELQIPPQLVNQAMPSYINGQWQVHGIQDQKTGRPVRLEYNINEGAGAVRIHKSDGINCNGSIQAEGKQSGLQINSTSQAACADGSHYDMPEIECRLNAHQETECFGRYGNQHFPISMRHATQ